MLGLCETICFETPRYVALKLHIRRIFKVFLFIQIFNSKKTLLSNQTNRKHTHTHVRTYTSTDACNKTPANNVCNVDT